MMSDDVFRRGILSWSSCSTWDDAVPPEPDVRAEFPRAEAAKARRRSLRNKLLGAALMGGLTVGVSVMSCVGQSFSLRQARTLEGIEHRLELMQQRCEAPR